MKKTYIFGLNLKISEQIASLFDMYIDIGERIAEKQDRPSLFIEDPPQGPPNSPNYTLFFTFWPLYMKNWFSNCFPLLYINYVSTVMRSAFADILVPLDFM